MSYRTSPACCASAIACHFTGALARSLRPASLIPPYSSNDVVADDTHHTNDTGAPSENAATSTECSPSSRWIAR